MATKEQVQLAKELATYIKQANKETQLQAKTLEEIKKHYADEIADLIRRNELLGIANDSAEVGRQVSELQLKSLKAQIEALLSKEKITDKEREQLKKLLEDQKKLTEELEEQNEKLKKQNELQALQNDLKQEALGLAENLVQQFGFLTAQSNAYTRTLSKGVDLLAKQKGLGKGMTAALKGAAVVVGGLVSRSVEYSDLVQEGEKSLIAFGLSSDQASKSIRSISKDFIAAGNAPKDFIEALQTIQEQGGTRLREALDTGMIETLARANKAGLDTASATKVLNEAIVQQGMTVDQANNKLGSLIAISKGLGEPIGTATKEFVQFSDRLGHAGPRAIEVFKRLKEVSKASGVEIGKLLDIAKGFDTFEDAAEATTKLNIILGTQLNAVELNMMSDEARIDKIRETIKASGRLNDLTDAQRRAVENTLPANIKFNDIIGLTNDVKVADVDLTKDQAGELKNLTVEQKKGLKAQEAVSSALMANSKVLGEGLAATSKMAAQAASGMGGAFLAAAEGIMGAAKAFIAFGPAAVTAGAGAATGMTAAGKAGQAAAPGLSSAGVALIEFGAGVAITVLPVAALVAAIGYLVESVVLLVREGDRAINVLGALAEIALKISVAFNPIALIMRSIGQLGLDVAEAITKVVEAGGKVGLGMTANLISYAGAVATLAAAINKVNELKAREIRSVIDAGFKLTTGGTTAGAAGRGSAQTVTVNLTLDGKTLATETVKIMNGQLSS